jgi:hypothetical protein
MNDDNIVFAKFDSLHEQFMANHREFQNAMDCLDEICGKIKNNTRFLFCSSAALLSITIGLQSSLANLCLFVILACSISINIMLNKRWHCKHKEIVSIEERSRIILNEMNQEIEKINAKARDSI